MKKESIAILRKEKFCIIIPVYNHEKTIAEIVKAAVRFSVPVIVVNDGSTDSTRDRIKNLKGITIISHDENRGKGAALKSGMAEASGHSRWAVSIDADGQHNSDDIENFVIFMRDNGLFNLPAGSRRPFLVGMRENMMTGDIPWTSRFGRKFSNFWVYLSGGPRLSDTQSGFRVYPVPESIDVNAKADRFQFEVEILVKAGWKGYPVYEVPVRVIYPPGQERISHFRPFIDFLRNSSAFTRLIAQRILIPAFIRKRVGWYNRCR
jgi:glycosyltransferase involved in cell wall biosynthesis